MTQKARKPAAGDTAGGLHNCSLLASGSTSENTLDLDARQAFSSSSTLPCRTNRPAFAAVFAVGAVP